MLNEYIKAVIKLSVFASVLLLIGHKRTKKTAVFATGMILLVAIMLPLINIFNNIDGINDFNFDLDNIVSGDVSDAVIEQSFEKGIGKYIADEYGVDEECVLVLADGFDISVMRAERIYITLSGMAVFLDYKRIEADVRAEFTNGGKCEVRLDVG